MLLFIDSTKILSVFDMIYNVFCLKTVREKPLYMGITRYTLPQNNGNLPLPFFVGSYPIVLLNNIYS